MTLSTVIALFTTMTVLAIFPSISALTVSARSITSGFKHGVFTTIGIVVGDVLFILLAIVGLTVLAGTMGEAFVWIKYLGGTYLIWLGIKYWRSPSQIAEPESVNDTSLLSSFLTGLFITLADQKAILFYFGFFPAFVDLSNISYLDTSIIIVIAIVAVGGAKLVYAYMATRAGMFINAKTYQLMNNIVGSVMIAIGAFLILKS